MRNSERGSGKGEWEGARLRRWEDRKMEDRKFPINETNLIN
jgi:hypothetical protein